MNDEQLRAALDDLATDQGGDVALPPATARRVARRRGLKLAAAGAGGVAALVLATSLVLTATGPSEERLVPADPTPSASPVPTPSSSASPVPSPPAPLPPAEPSAAPAPVSGPVVLRPDGLAVRSGSTTSSLPFGADATTVRAAVDAALGAGGERQTPDCGPGSTTVQYEGIFLLVQDGEFVGWVTGSPGLTTDDGIGVGSTLAELRVAFGQLEVGEGTAGVEFATGEAGFTGTLDSGQEDGVVQSLSAGDQCVAR